MCDILRKGDSVSIIAHGDSMVPKIIGGRDSLCLSPATRPVPGAIVLARTDLGYVIHRIIAVEADRVTLMGDGNLVRTEHCRPSDIYGTVTSISGRKASGALIWRSLRPVRRYLLFALRLLRPKLFENAKIRRNEG